MNEATNTVPCAPREIKLTPADEVNFWAKVNKDGPTMPGMDSPCWVWTASKDRKGYGNIRIAGDLFRAHRVVWTLYNGQVPYGVGHHGICVCHRCDRRDCTNPTHLFLGTNTENMRDMFAKKRNGSITRPDRIARGEIQGSAKLVVAQVLEIRALYAAGGITLKQLATRYGVHLTLIHAILRRKIWRHI